jgi:alpha-L-rhamnosidase
MTHQCSEALHFDLFPTTAQQEVAISRLDELIRREAKFKIATGFAKTPVIRHALSKAGYLQLFYRMLMDKKNPSWLYPLTMGATTI